MIGRLIAYLDSIKARDPAPRSRWEIMLYPGVWALGFHKVAHRLFRARLAELVEERDQERGLEIEGRASKGRKTGDRSRA